MSAQSQRWVVDEIEEKMVSIELDGGTMITVPMAILPKGVKSGHVLRAIIEIDEAGTQQAVADSAAQVKKGSNASRKRDRGGDIVL